MSWSITAKGQSSEVAKIVREQVNAFIGSRSDTEKAVILAGAEAVTAISNQYPDAELAVSYHGHAGDSSLGSFVLNISTPPKEML